MDSNKEPKHQINLLVTSIQLRAEHRMRLLRLAAKLEAENKLDHKKIGELKSGD